MTPCVESEDEISIVLDNSSSSIPSTSSGSLSTPITFKQKQQNQQQLQSQQQQSIQTTGEQHAAQRQQDAGNVAGQIQTLRFAVCICFS